VHERLALGALEKADSDAQALASSSITDSRMRYQKAQRGRHTCS